MTTRLERIETLRRKAPLGETCAEEVADAIAPLVPLLREWEAAWERHNTYQTNDTHYRFVAAERALLAALRGAQ